MTFIQFVSASTPYTLAWTPEKKRLILYYLETNLIMRNYITDTRTSVVVESVQECWYFTCVSYTRIFLHTINELKKIFTNWENQNSSKLQNSQYAMCHIEIHFWTLQYDLKLILVACKAIDLLFHKRSFPNEIHFGVEYVIFFQLSIYELILNIFVGASGNIFILIYKIICTITF